MGCGKTKLPVFAIFTIFIYLLALKTSEKRPVDTIINILTIEF